MDLTRSEIERREELGLPVSVGFTGLYKGQHYYRGERWEGPSNAIGKGGEHGKLTRQGGKGIRPTDGTGERFSRASQKFGNGKDVMYSGCFSAMRGC